MKRFPALLMAILAIGALALPAGAAPEPAHTYDLDDGANNSASFSDCAAAGSASSTAGPSGSTVTSPSAVSVP